MNITFVDWLAVLFVLLYTTNIVISFWDKPQPRPLKASGLGLYIVAIAWLLSRSTS